MTIHILSHNMLPEPAFSMQQMEPKIKTSASAILSAHWWLIYGCPVPVPPPSLPTSQSFLVWTRWPRDSASACSTQQIWRLKHSTQPSDRMALLLAQSSLALDHSKILYQWLALLVWSGTPACQHQKNTFSLLQARAVQGLQFLKQIETLHLFLVKNKCRVIAAAPCSSICI